MAKEQARTPDDEKPVSPRAKPGKVKPQPLAPTRELIRTTPAKVRIPKLSPAKPDDDETRSWLARWVLIGLAPFVLLIVYIVATASKDDARLDALKFLLPSVVSVLTLVLGYYFGQHRRR
jgi:hypothetical protein